MRFRIPRKMLLCVLIALPRVVAKAQSDRPEQLTEPRLASLSASKGGNPIDCGTSNLSESDPKATACASVALQNHKPFRILYSRPSGFFQSAYGLAGDADGNLYELQYDSRGLLNLGLRKNSKVFDGNRVTVTACLKPPRVGSTPGGLLTCVPPVNESESIAAAQQNPIDTTVCAILEHPSAFNNKVVRVRGYASAGPESSELGADECTGTIWFAYGGGSGPPGLVAHVGGGAQPGSEDAEGKWIRPVPVKLVQNLNFNKFQKLMRAQAKADERDLKKDGETWTFHRVAATFTGRIDAVSDDVHAFHLKREVIDRADFLGFGQMGLFDAQFTLRSVANDAVLENFPPIPNPLRRIPPMS